MTTMRFEARELKPYAEPISARELREGIVYYFLNFVDEEMLIPTMETVVFVGRNLEADDDDRVYFQDIESYTRGVRYNSATHDDHAVFSSGSEKELGHVFDYQHALDQLLICAIRRNRAGLDTSISM